MNVLLMYPPVDAEVPAKSTLLGLGYLASMLREQGHEVQILDFCLSDTTFLYNFQPHAIGVSVMFTQYKKSALRFTSELRRFFPRSQIILGGAHASTFPDECLEFADCVVVGEGEEEICDIVENRRTGIIRADRIKDLDSLPMPAWDLMLKDIKIMNKLSKDSPFHMRKPIAHIITSRGCPNNCTFCAVKVAWGRRWIARSAKNVVDEIQLLNNSGFKEIHFNDDNCSISKERMYAICHELLRRKINIKIACPTGIHIGTLDKPLLTLMKNAGFYRLCFGIETGNPDMQKTIKKNIDLDKARKVIKDANDLGYWTAATFILGFPEETEEQINDTYEFAMTSGIDFPIFYKLQIQPKTEIYDRIGLQKVHKV